MEVFVMARIPTFKASWLLLYSILSPSRLNLIKKNTYRFQPLKFTSLSILFSTLSSSCGKKSIPVLLSISSIVAAKTLIGEDDPELDKMNPIIFGLEPPLNAIL
jgi:hypothetical protein